ILAAGTYNTQKLLFKMRDRGRLPKLSNRLGTLTRTNSESIVGAARLQVSPDLDLTHGVAITSSIHPTPDTHIEPVRYGKGSNAMGLLQTLMTDGAGPQGTDVPRWKQLIDQVRADPRRMLRLLNPRHWSERTVIPLVMQHLDNSITTFTQRGKLGIRRYSSRQGHGEPNPSWIPVGNEVTRRIAAKIDGVAGGTWGELFNIPLTAHFLGGAAIGDSPEHGVIDPYQRVYNYPTLSVMDGAAVSANLGVNPSLSITAQAERAASLWPNKGETDLRPAQGEPYRRLDPIAPKNPVVPAGAPGALRWLPSAGDDAERSDAEERRKGPDPINSVG
ncbi:MAG: GMC oxidoreductase, partial [Mycobacterium sp.]